jgi:hypothetical protein
MASAYPNLVRPGALRDNAIISPHAIKHAGLIYGREFSSSYVSPDLFWGSAGCARVRPLQSGGSRNARRQSGYLLSTQPDTIRVCDAYPNCFGPGPCVRLARRMHNPAPGSVEKEV